MENIDVGSNVNLNTPGTNADFISCEVFMGGQSDPMFISI